MNQWKARTTVGRVVYDRPTHYMNAHDAERMVYKVWERINDNSDLLSDPKYVSEWDWTRILDLAQNAMKYMVKYKIPAEEIPPSYVKQGFDYIEVPTGLHWTAARLIYWIEQIKAMLAPVIGVAGNATLELVWNVGMFFLDLSLDALKKKMGTYRYVPPPKEELYLS